MNRHYLLFFLCVFPLAAQSLKFKNGDSLRGDIVETDGKNLKWLSDSLGMHVEVPVEKLEKMIFTEKRPKWVTSYQAQVFLHRGDVYSGDLMEMTDDELVLITDWAGEVRVNRRFVDRISPLRVSKNYLGSLDDLSDWKGVTNRDKWELIDDKLIARKRVVMSKKANAPEVFKLSTDYTVSSNGSRMKFLLCASEGEVYDPLSYFQIQFSNSSVLARGKVDGEVDNLGQAISVKDFTKKKKHKIEIFCNLPEKQAEMFVNGKSVTQWLLPDGLQNGSWVYLASDYVGDGAITLENTRLEEWNGVLPVEKADMAMSNKKGATIIYLNNGDLIDARKVSYGEGKLVADTELGEIKVDLATVKKLDFSSLPYREAKRVKGDVLLQLKNADLVTINLNSWKDGVLNGFSQNYGEISIPEDEVAGVRFNIYK